MTATFTYADDTRPIRLANIVNGRGYLDLVLAKNANGKAIRIANKHGDRVMVSLDKVDSLIDSLQKVKARGAKVSVDDTDFANATSRF